MAETIKRPWHRLRDWFTSFSQGVDAREEDLIWLELNRLQKEISVLREEPPAVPPRQRPAE